MTKEEIKALQTEMKRRGIYSGDIDGVSGPQTDAAKKIYDQQIISEKAAQGNSEALKRADELRAKELELKGLELQQTGAKQGVENKASEEEIARKKLYNEQATSPGGIVAETMAGAPSILGGTYIGREMGKGTNYWMDEAQKKKNLVLQGVAADRKAGLTTLQGARSGAELSGATPSQYSALRVGGRMLPNLGLGGFMAGKGALMLSNEDEKDPFYPKMVNRGAALGMIASGAGLGEQALRYGFSPGVSPDAQALGIINSNQLRRNNQSASPEIERAMTPRQQLVEQAKAAGIKNTARMNMTSLGEALSQVKKLPPGTAGAGLAATMAYAMTPDRAEAADGSSIGGPSEALTNAAAAGGAAYGGSKLIDKLAPIIGKASAPLGEASMPSIIDSMTDYSPEDKAMARNWLARHLPESLQFGAVNDAREMAQVPTPSPRRPYPGNPEYPLSGPMPNAEAIPVPYPDLVSAMGRSAPAQSPPPSPAATMQMRRLVEAMMQGR